MPVPESYTEESLAAYMHAVVGRTATQINWSVVAGSYEQAVIDTLYLMDVNDISEVEDLRLLRAAARLTVWRAVEADTAGDADFTTDGQRVNLSQIHDHAVKMVGRAEEAAAGLGIDISARTVQVFEIEHTDSPYRTVSTTGTEFS